jgi:uncharacterized protein YjiS (DUF1127 family)
MMKSQRGYAIAAALPRGSRPQVLKYLSTAWAQLKRWYELDRQRRQLAMLGDAALKDLGLSRADIVAETERPFWDDPLKH